MINHTFVICAYKESQYLEACVKSLKRQKLQSNIIVVTSTPNDYIKRIAEKYQLDYYVNEGQGGITQDWNFGYKCAIELYGSEYVTIAHQDDIYDKNYLTEVAEALNTVKHPLILFSDYYEIRDNKKICRNKLLTVKRMMLIPLRFHPFRNSIWIRRRILSLGSPICCPSVTYVVKNLPQVIFENHYRACEDWEAWEKISKLQGEFIYIPRMLMGHRIHDESETTACIVDNHRTTEELEMFCKFWPVSIARVISKKYSDAQGSNRVNG